MPKTSRSDYDARITYLINQLRAALIAHEQAQIEAKVSAQLDGLVRGLGAGAVRAATAAPAGRVAAAATPKKRKGWSPAAKAKARERMKAYWAARRKGTAPKATTSKS